MAMPVQTQILDEIGTRLSLITTANGYLRAVAKLERARLTPFKNGDLPAINYYSTADSFVDKGHTFDKRSLSVAIESYDLTRDAIFDDVAQQLAADVTISINRSSASPAVTDDPSISLGGIVEQVTVTSITPAIGDGQKPYCGAVIFLEIVYKVKKLDPFTLIS